MCKIPNSILSELNRNLKMDCGPQVIDIAYEASVLSRYLSQPRTGHLVQALHIFKYPDLHKSNELAFDPAYHDVKDPQLVQARIAAMKEMFPDAVEDLPPNAPTSSQGQPCGNELFC